ncbi:hypothetical protein [Rudaea sp.]|uniref:hypothetical protein n=1 Tax=Rudaea sp. TaxID=2136325 RepID=UPI0037836481
MALTIHAHSDEVISPEEFLDYVAANVDADSIDSVAAAAPMLSALNNNKTFLRDLLHDDMRKILNGEMSALYSLQSAIVAKKDRFSVRANFWTIPNSTPRRMQREDKILSYREPHDHNFIFMTVGHIGPGYRTVIHEYDKSKVVGYVGENVELKFLEETTLPEGKIMLYRPCVDIHTQYYPEKPSVSINLMVPPEDEVLRDQYFFDTNAGVILGYVPTNVSIRVSIIDIVSKFADDNTVQLLQDTVQRHPCVRTKHAALMGLAGLVDETEVRRIAENIPQTNSWLNMHLGDYVR